MQEPVRAYKIIPTFFGKSPKFALRIKRHDQEIWVSQTTQVPVSKFAENNWLSSRAECISITRSTLAKHSRDLVPYENCSCGWYALSKPRYLYSTFDHYLSLYEVTFAPVIYEVFLYGKVIEHEPHTRVTGKEVRTRKHPYVYYRAEYFQLVSAIFPRKHKINKSVQGMAKNLSSALQLPVRWKNVKYSAPYH